MTDSTNTFGRRPRGRPATIQWQEEFRCSCAGKPADRRQDDLPQAKRRKSQGSIACGCRARIVLTQNIGSEAVIVAFHWKHSGHEPNTIEDMIRQRNTARVRGWICDRIGQGLGWVTIKGFLRTKPDMLNQVRFISRSNCSSSRTISCQIDQECLSAGPSNITQLPEAFRVKYDDVYNQFRKVIQNQARLATEGRESLLEWAKLLESNRWGVLQRECSSGEQLFACVSPFQQQVGVILSQLECLSLPLPAF